MRRSSTPPSSRCSPSGSGSDATGWPSTTTCPASPASAPAVLIAHLAAATSTIRVGSGGVMLPNHAPLVVAEQFGMLEALHPGRIDLGIGRAPGTDPLTARALRRRPTLLGADDFPQQLGDLVRFFDGSFPDDHP